VTCLKRLTPLHFLSDPISKLIRSFTKATIEIDPLDVLFDLDEENNKVAPQKINTAQ
jgi:hypothetical protein